MLSNHLVLCHPLPLLPSVFPRIRVFFNELALHIRWPKYWSFSFSIVLPVNIQVVSFRNDWFDFLAVEGTLKSLLQHHQFESINSSVLSFLYGPTITFTTRKNIALTIWTFVSKVISLLFNTLARCVTAFLPRSKHLLISCLQSPPAVILEHKKIKIFHCFHCFPHLFAMK